MAARYKYINEDEVVVIEATSYEIIIDVIPSTVTQWQIIGKYRDLSFTEQPILTFVSRPISVPNPNFTEKIWYYTSLNSSGRIQGFTPNPDLGEGEVFSYWVTEEDEFANLERSIDYETYLVRQEASNNNYPPPGNYAPDVTSSDDLTHWTYIDFNPTVSPWYSGNKRYLDIELEFLKLHPADGVKTYELKLYQNNQAIFSRTEQYQPQYVEIFEGLTCPENTCPVKCGDTVCCYGNDGIATDSFLLSESVYQ